MARTVTVTFDDGSSHVYQQIPDDVTPQQVIQRASKDFSGRQVTGLDGGNGAATTASTPAEPSPGPKINIPAKVMNLAPMTPTEKALAAVPLPESMRPAFSAARGFNQGMADPFVGAAQLGANLISPLVPSSVSQQPISDRFNQWLAEDEAKQKALGTSEGWRVVGNIASPANLIGGAELKGARTLGQMATKGAKVGGILGLVQPVEDTTNGYWGQKAGQTVLGAAGGAALSPLIGTASAALGNAVNSVVNKFRSASQNDINQATEKIVTDWLNTAPQEIKAMGFNMQDIPESILNGVKQKVADALKTGKQVDPAALLRQADFEAAGVSPTAGQLSRDVQQYTQERNLRGVQGAGNPLAQRFAQQGQQLRAAFPTANVAAEPFTAGNRLIGALQAADQPHQSAVSALYQAARGEGGRAAQVDVPGFVTAANDALDQQMLGRFLPAQAKGLLNDISTGKIPLNVGTLVQADSVLSEAQRGAMASGDKAGARAVGVVRDALNNANVASTEGQQAKAAFDVARGAARERFANIEATPALKAALDNPNPDTFVKKFVIGAPTNDLTKLVENLGGNQEAKDEVRSQIADYLKRKAFGGDLTGDAPFSPERFNDALKGMGKNKLAAIFSPDEIEKLYAAGRVMSYIKTQPEGSAVNNSNTAAGVMNLLSELTGKVGALPGFNIARNSVRDYMAERAANRAVKGGVQTTPITTAGQEAANRLSQLLGAAGGAAVTGSLFRK